MIGRPSPAGPAAPQRTLGHEANPATGKTVGYDGSPPARLAAAPTVAYEPPAPPPPPPAAGGFDATMVADGPAPSAPQAAPPVRVVSPAISGFDATINADAAGVALPSVGAVARTPTAVITSAPADGVSAPAAAPLSQAPRSAPASVGASQGPRSTVLPRVELLDGKPRISVRDRPRYQERKKLGEGGVGEVVLAQDNDIERTVALKRLRPGLQATSALSRFVEEIRTVGQLEHPSIVPIHDVGLDEQGQFYFVMKFVNGETLEHIIERLAEGDPHYIRNFPFERRVEIFHGILEAMAYAHDQGIIHRDIKPANIMVGPYGEVMVMDWGLAKKIGQKEAPIDDPDVGDSLQKSGRMHETRVGSILGTPMYMSPEQARGQHDTLDQRSDIYSLSVMLHELLSLRHYLHGRADLAQVLHGVVNDSVELYGTWESPHQPPIPADLRHFVFKGLHKDPAQRYQSVHEMIDRLRRRAEGDIPVECPVTMSLSMTTWGRRQINKHPYVASTAIFVLLLTSLASMAFSVFHLMRGA